MNRSSLAAVVALLLLTPVNFALAALPGPPELYVVLSRDGTHVLVMLAPGTVDELGAQYPVSGYYELCSDVPLWTVNWFEGNCHLSEDGRYLVECHLNPEPERGTPTSWALKFYDHGHEIGSYDLADLVDYPALLWRHSYRWHWIDYWADDNEQIHDGRFYLRTSTRERYSFDITTGTIVEEHHFWRNVSTTAKAVLFVSVSGLVLWYFRIKKRRLERSAMRRLNQPPVASRRSFRFSIQSLIVFTAVCSVFAAIFRAAPHVGVFLTSASIPLVVVFFIRPSRVASTMHRCAARGLTFACWLPFYVLSIGPALAIVEYFLAEWDVRMAVLYVVYYPMIRTETMWSRFAPDIVGSYFDAWR